ncbi:MAG: hypothetical protein JW904_14850, partial [Spirochaetales bacterium]|nr:hypothetical protein [Spirochaetales bacterium]
MAEPKHPRRCFKKRKAECPYQGFIKIIGNEKEDGAPPFRAPLSLCFLFRSGIHLKEFIRKPGGQEKDGYAFQCTFIVIFFVSFQNPLERIHKEARRPGK